MSKRALSLTEHQEQKLLIEWASYQSWHRLLFAIPNGGYRRITEARRLKAEGVRAGIPDLFLAKPNESYHGLWLEMKTKKGKASKAQLEMIELLKEQGYQAQVCHGFNEARDVIREYLNEQR